MGVALQRMGDYLYQMGKTEEALKQFNLSLAIFDKLGRDDPQNDWLPWNSAISYDNIGRITQELKGNRAAAREYYIKSMHLREKLLANPRKDGPEAAARRVGLAVSYNKLAEFSQQIGDSKLAREFAQKELDATSSRAATGFSLASELYADALTYLGNASVRLGDAESGQQYFKDGLRAWREISKSDPTNAVAKKKTGIIYDSMGDAAAGSRKGQEALAYYQEGNAIYSAMHEKEPQNAELLWLLAYSHYRIATAKRLCGDLVGAQKSDNESLRLREKLFKTDPNNLQRIEELMISLARCGDIERASKMAEDVRQRAPKDPIVLVAAACCYGACIQALQKKTDARQINEAEASALRRRYTKAAIESASQAIAHGYQDRYALERSLDLEAFQASPEYKKMLEKLQ
jgi:hypothetical protein